jgi:hypothetical protein
VEGRSLHDLSERSFRHMQGFRANVVLQLPRMIRVAGEEEDLVVLCEGSAGLDGGGAAGERGIDD